MRCPLLYGFLLLAVVGCRPSVENQDLGEVLYELPNVPEAREPYKLPNLDPEKEPAVDTAAENSPDSTDLVSPPVGKSSSESAPLEQPSEEEAQDLPK